MQLGPATSGNGCRKRTGRLRGWWATPGLLPAVLLFAGGCGAGGGPASDSGPTASDLSADAAPPTVAGGSGEHRHAAGATEPPPAQRPGPRTRQQLIESSGAEPFERYLAGPWYRHAEGGGDAADGQRVEIVHFEPEQRRITFFDGEVQEIYSWNRSDPRTASRIAILMRNALVTSVEKTIVAEVGESEELRLQVWSSDTDDESDRNGTYRRLAGAARHELVRATAPQPGMVRLELNGLYHGSDGETLVFDAPRFTWQQDGRRLTGGFAVYSAGTPVIVFKVVSRAGNTSDIRTYALDFREHRGAERVRRSLILHPATLEITGLAAVGAAALHFEQVELADAPDAAEPEGGGQSAPAAGG